MYAGSYNICTTFPLDGNKESQGESIFIGSQRIQYRLLRLREESLNTPKSCILIKENEGEMSKNPKESSGNEHYLCSNYAFYYMRGRHRLAEI